MPLFGLSRDVPRNMIWLLASIVFISVYIYHLASSTGSRSGPEALNRQTFHKCFPPSSGKSYTTECFLTLFIVSFSGTTWLQEITWQIYNGGKTSSEPIGHRVQFFDEAKYLGTTQPDITTQPSPRLMKTHQPYHTIPKGASDATACKYIYVARNPKDVVVSYYKFESKMAPLTGYSGPFEFFAKMFLEGKSKLIKTRSIEKALNQHQFNHPTAVSDQFSLPDHSIKDIELISFEHRDSIHKAREGFLISVGKILEPCGRNGRDET